MHKFALKGQVHIFSFINISEFWLVNLIHNYFYELSLIFLNKSTGNKHDRIGLEQICS